MNKLIKNNAIKISAIFIIVALFIGKLFPVNYPTDIYNIRLLGLKEYAFKWFLPSGRLVGILCLNVLDAFNVSIDVYIFLMKIISLIIATATIYLFYDLIIKCMKKSSTFRDIIVILLTLVLFLNHGTYQFFYYPESGVMWLAVFFVVLALRCMILGSKKKYLKSWFCIFIAMNCYQAIIYFYLPALVLLLGTKEKTIKEELVDLVKNTAIILSNLIIGYIIVSIARTCFDVISFQSTKINFNMQILIDTAYMLLISFRDTVPNLYLLYGNIILFGIVVILKRNMLKEKKLTLIIRMLLITFIAFAEVVCTIGILDFYNGDRIQFAYIVTVSLNIIAISLYTNLLEKEATSVLMYAISVVVISLNMFNSYDLTRNSILAREYDQKIGEELVNKIKEYELKSNEKVERLIYCYDDYYWECELNIRFSFESSARIISNWSTDTALQYYLGEGITIIGDQGVYEQYFNGKNWDYFDDDQIIFEDNTMYLCFY